MGVLERSIIHYFFLLSTYTEELISTPKIAIFLPDSPVGNEKFTLIANPVPYPEYLYLSISAFFTNLTAPNKEFSNAGSLLST